MNAPRTPKNACHLAMEAKSSLALTRSVPEGSDGESEKLVASEVAL